MNETYMAIDQYGTTFHNLGKHPRAELMRRLYAGRAAKMYVDKVDGSYEHIGWVVRGHWCRVYRVLPLNADRR